MHTVGGELLESARTLQGLDLGVCLELLGKMLHYLK